MKKYTVYDDVDGGFTIWWTSYDKYNSEWIKKNMVVNTKESMLMWKRKFESGGYKFVGKI